MFKNPKSHGLKMIFTSVLAFFLALTPVYTTSRWSARGLDGGKFQTGKSLGLKYLLFCPPHLVTPTRHESALPTATPFIAANRSPSGSLGGDSRGSWLVETVPLRHYQ